MDGRTPSAAAATATALAVVSVVNDVPDGEGEGVEKKRGTYNTKKKRVMGKDEAMALLDEGARIKTLNAAAKHLDRHLALRPDPAEYNSVFYWWEKWRKDNPNALEEAARIARRHLRQRLAEIARGQGDRLTDAEEHARGVLGMGGAAAEAAAGGVEAGDDAAAVGVDALINGLVESVARLTTELAEVRSRVEVLEGQQPAEARRSDQQQE